MGPSTRVGPAGSREHLESAAKCVDTKGNISFENIANQSECLCFEHNKFGDKGMCKSGKCVH